MNKKLTKKEQKLIIKKLQQPCNKNLNIDYKNQKWQLTDIKDLLQLIPTLDLKNTVLEIGSNFGYISNILKSTFPDIDLISIDSDSTCVKYSKIFYPELKFIKKNFKFLTKKQLKSINTFLFFRVPFLYIDFKYILKKFKRNNITNIRIIFYIAKVNFGTYFGKEYSLRLFKELKKDYNLKVLSPYAIEVTL